MITTLTGTNVFLLGQELSRLIDVFVAEHTDMGLERLDGEEVSFDRIRESLESLPFLASRKMVVLRNPSANKEFVEKTLDLLGAVPDTTDVIIIEPKLDKRLSYYKFLKKNSDYQEFNEPDESGLTKWLVSTAKEQGGTMSSADARYLVERVGAKQQLLANELTKLLSYDSNITRQTIDLLTEPTPASTIFELLEAALAGRTKRALTLYTEQRAMKVEPQQILAMLAWQLHVLAVVKTAPNRDANTIAREAKLNPFVVRKTLAAAKRLTLAEVKELVQKTLELDIRLKSQPIDADEALLQLLSAFSAR